MASKVKVVGGGHPQGEAVRQFFLRVDKDPQWHPGKRGEVGRPKELTGHKRHIIAKSMMAKKKAKIEPCYEAVLEHCPNASINPTTGRPFSQNAINDVLTTETVGSSLGRLHGTMARVAPGQRTRTENESPLPLKPFNIIKAQRGTSLKTRAASHALTVKTETRD